MLEKYNGGGSKDVHKIVTGNKSWIYAYEPEIKQQSTMWAFEDKPNLTEILSGKCISKQMVVCFFGKTGHVATEWYITISLKKFEKQEKTIHCSQWQCELSHIGSNQRLFDRPK